VVRIAWILLSALFIVYRLHALPSVFVEDQFIVEGSDPYYRLFRVEKIVNDSFVYPLKDKHLSYPDGFEVPWPLGLEYVLAIFEFKRINNFHRLFFLLRRHITFLYKLYFFSLSYFRDPKSISVPLSTSFSFIITFAKALVFVKA